MSTLTAYVPGWDAPQLDAGFQPMYDANDPKTWFAPGVRSGYSSLGELYHAWIEAGRPTYGALPDSPLTRKELGQLLRDKGGKVFRQQRRSTRFGPVLADGTTYAWSDGSGVQQPYKQYATASGTVLPQTWYEPQGAPRLIPSNGTFVVADGGNFALPTYRFMTDTVKLDAAFLGGSPLGVEVFIDNVPLFAPMVAGGAWLDIVFPSAKPRLVEIRTGCAFGGVLVGTNSMAWKPAPATGPRILVVGDSYGQAYGATVMNNGMYQRIADEMDVEDVYLDVLNGTGYVNQATMTPFGGTPGNFNDRLASHIAVQPDMLVINDGGVNDLNMGTDVPTLTDAITKYFRNARAALPNAKLVFVEPFAPNGLASIIGQYPAVIAAARAALAPYGVHFVSTYTNGSWLTGTGYAGNLKGDGNGDLYLIADAVHPNDAGHTYLRRRMAPHLLNILAAAA